ncbi:ComEC/Rec2 family competence protein [Hymenobacter chitinivorans]|uniref:Competence protein ComEC n=1 Tax=Hymenobacter chitinivorans DSM 11115 TaxID=1121954 RepID=A0A2M9BMV2_9BACT|nr:ComEC/Rec2 family competence protein [Hymenobacter chitinivorans]PJJ59293.1 competence protein ComEC [Hymenobacter chitinivorans DSM 11115]
MIQWAPYAFVRLFLALAAGVLTYLYFGAALPDLRWPLAGLTGVFIALQTWASRQPNPGPTDAAGMLAIICLFVAGLTLTQQATEKRRSEHLSQLTGPIEFYRAVVDDYTVVRPATYATTVRVSAVRVAGQWRAALGGIRVSVPRDSGVTQPRYGDVWLVRGGPASAKAPLNPGEFDYRRYLSYHQVYHQQFIHADQYRRIAYQPPLYVKAVSMRAARVLDAVFRQYVHQKREYALASALVLGIKDDVDQDTKQAYANTGTTHIMAVSGLQVGLLFGAVTWLLGLLPGRRGPLFRLTTAALGLAVIWSYAFLTGLSASVLRAAVMFTFVILARATGRQSNMYNTLAVAAFCLLCYDPYLLADVGFQLSFLAVLSIVYLQPRIAAWVDFKDKAAARIRPWQPRAVQQLWRAGGWLANWIWQATALSLAAQVATFPLGLFYFHQFPLSFLASNLVAVPISSLAVYVGLALLAVKGLVALAGLVLPAALTAGLDWLPQGIAWLFEKMILAFNEYIFWIGRTMPGALIQNVHVTPLQAWLIFAMILAVLVFLAVKRLPWLGLACALLAIFAGTRVWAARTLTADEQLVIYSIPRRSVCGFWQGAAAHIVTVDSLPLSETERTYRIVPGIIQREARQVAYHTGWQPAPVPTAQPMPHVTVAVWRGLRLAFVSGRIDEARIATPVDVLVLRRNAWVKPKELAQVFGRKARVIFDSSCKSWYVAHQDSLLQAAGFQTHDVTSKGAFIIRPRPLVGSTRVLAETE